MRGIVGGAIQLRIYAIFLQSKTLKNAVTSKMFEKKVDVFMASPINPINSLQQGGFLKKCEHVSPEKTLILRALP